jgi:hypothetical protein
MCLPAREFILDLAANPHAYLIGCPGQRSSRAERAWELPYEQADVVLKPRDYGTRCRAEERAL